MRGLLGDVDPRRAPASRPPRRASAPSAGSASSSRRSGTRSAASSPAIHACARSSPRAGLERAAVADRSTRGRRAGTRRGSACRRPSSCRGSDPDASHGRPRGRSRVLVTIATSRGVGRVPAGAVRAARSGRSVERRARVYDTGSRRPDTVVAVRASLDAARGSPRASPPAGASRGTRRRRARGTRRRPSCGSARARPGRRASAARRGARAARRLSAARSRCSAKYSRFSGRRHGNTAVMPVVRQRDRKPSRPERKLRPLESTAAPRSARRHTRKPRSEARAEWAEYLARQAGLI